MKIGTAVLTRENGTLDGESLVRIVTAVAAVKAAGYDCLMVSSGAVGAGVRALGLESYPNDTATRQAAASIGQVRLMHQYQTLFQQFDLHVAQLLLTRSDLRDRRKRISSTIKRLLEQDDLIPIVNENDSIAVEELRVGDNDILSAKVAEFLGARQLILFTSVDGLLDENMELIDRVDDVDQVMGMVKGEIGKFSIGGMASKLKAVKSATEAGVKVLIANGRKPEQLLELVEGRGRGTRFPASAPQKFPGDHPEEE